MNYFITGSLGFIGKELVAALKKNKKNIVIEYDKNCPDNFKKNIIKGDVRDFKLLSKSIPSKVDIIIHLAAEHRDEDIDISDYYSVNVNGTENILRVASAKKIKKIIYFSSSAVYGSFKLSNENSITNPINNYGKSKLKAENLVKKWVKNSGNKAIILRPSAVYGPNNKANIHSLISRVSSGKYFQVGNGKNVKSFIYIQNLINSTQFCIDNFNKKFTCYNLVDEPSLSIVDFVDLINNVAGSRKKRFIYIPFFIGIFLVLSQELLAKLLKFEPFISVAKLKKFSSNTMIDGTSIKKDGYKQLITTERGIEDTIDWIKKESFKVN